MDTSILQASDKVALTEEEILKKEMADPVITLTLDEIENELKKIGNAYTISILTEANIRIIKDAADLKLPVLDLIFSKVKIGFENNVSIDKKINDIPNNTIDLIVYVLSKENCNGCAESTVFYRQNTRGVGGRLVYLIPTGGGWKLLLARLKGTDAYRELSPEEKEFFRINTEAINKKRDSYSRTGSLFSGRGGKSKKARKGKSRKLRKTRRTRKSRKSRKSRRKH